MTNEELSKSLSNCVIKIPHLNLIHLSKVFFITNVTYLLQNIVILDPNIHQRNK